MKSIKYSLGMLFLSLFMITTGCKKEKSTADISKITYYPNFTYNGDEVVLQACGTNFSDPGVTATENGAALTVTTSVAAEYFGTSNSLSSISPDMYSITYSAVNKDGYSGEQHRTIYSACNGDLTTSIEGLYRANVVRNGVVSAQYQNLKYVIIKKLSGNTYQISDAIGGYYDMGRAYGAGYAAAGMTINAVDIATNNFTFGAPVGVGAFGGSLKIDALEVNATTKKIKFTSTWDAGYTFVVELTQVTI